VKRSYIVIAVVALAIGFLIGRSQGPEKVEHTEKIEKQRQVITDLEKRIKSLREENLKESVKTVIVEKPDGTKVTTRTRDTEKKTNVTKLSDEKEKSDVKESTKIETKTVTVFHSNHNAVGVRPSYKLFDRFEAEAYLKAGMKCFIFECYVEGSYAFVEKETRAIAGLEYRF